MKRNRNARVAALSLAVVMTVTTAPAVMMTGVPATAYAAGVTASGTVDTAIGAVSKAQIDTILNDTAKYVYKTVSDPQVASIGGEWAVIGLARSGYDVPDSWFEAYYNNLEEKVTEKEGVLHKKKYTDYSRVTVALSAIGGDPRDVAGYDLLKPLGDFDKTIWQGINGPIWALIALDSGDYTVPVNEAAAVQATREKYIAEILRRQLNDGGFSLTGGKTEATKGETADADITGMALQALAKYQDRADVKAATEKALACLSKMQAADAGFSSYNTSNVESCVQVIVALNELGISLNDSRFVKNGITLVDNMLKYYVKGNGFVHTLDGEGGADLMSTEQAFYGLVSIQRAMEGKNSLYCMDDAKGRIGESATSGIDGEAAVEAKGLAGKHKDVQIVPVIQAKTFADVQNHENQKAIEELASRGIISGRSADKFDPNATMTRAEFAAIVVNALGLELEKVDTFTDVDTNKWYAGFVGTAYRYGIVKGTSTTTFHPNGTITKQEAATMVVNAAKLCGMDTEMTLAEAQNILSQFPDYVQSSGWARTFLGFCYDQDILSQDDMTLEPKRNVKRCEIAEMLYRMMDRAELL
ncbi:MAG: S-layer homology domain-containing protein [Firmicutes bacterium]|nr:S-layer homology domain-containing protein [Bacillota bacterium]